MKRTYLLLIAIFFVACSFGQKYGDIMGQRFEELKSQNLVDSFKVKIGADFGMQFQDLGMWADSSLTPVGRGFNLPEANLNIDAFLGKGVRVNLVDYLSSRHHDTGIVKGGFIQFDKLPFIQSDVLDRVMDHVTIKVGEMELNYGDSHFRRTDCGRVINNAFVGNYIMDAFTTAPAAEIVAQNNGWLAELGTTTGTVNQVLTNNTNKYTAINVLNEMAVYGKIGFDKKFTPDVRVRLTLSGFHQGENQGGGYLYGGDRAGSRYYLIMNRQTSSPSTDVSISSNFFSGDFPTAITYTEDNSYVLSLFARIQGFEFFGTFESATGKTAPGAVSIGLNSNGPGVTGEFNFEQTAVEGLYHFGPRDQFYGGLRYDKVNEEDLNLSVNRTQFVFGWYLSQYVVAKVEYVNQNYTGFYGSEFTKSPLNSYGASAGFQGLMVEAGISF